MVFHFNSDLSLRCCCLVVVAVPTHSHADEILWTLSNFLRSVAICLYRLAKLLREVLQHPRSTVLLPLCNVFIVVTSTPLCSFSAHVICQVPELLNQMTTDIFVLIVAFCSPPLFSIDIRFKFISGMRQETPRTPLVKALQPRTLSLKTQDRAIVQSMFDGGTYSSIQLTDMRFVISKLLANSHFRARDGYKARG